MAPPMSGIRILDFCRFMQGPYGTWLLAELGAEVIKVERPGATPYGVPDKEGYYGAHEAVSRSKKSIIVDFGTAHGNEVLRRILPTVDVVTENFRPGVMERMGLGYERLAEWKPDIVMASASAWGREGPFSDRGGYDHVAQALSGAMSQQGSPHEPHALIGGVADVIGGTYLALSVATALLARGLTGVGQHADSSLLGSLTAIQLRDLSAYLRTGMQSGFKRYRSPTHTHYRCLDGRYIAIAANREPMWRRLCEVLGRDELLDDPRCADGPTRREHSAFVVEHLEEAFLQGTQHEWEERLTAADVPNAPVLDFEGVINHPQFAANGYIQEFEHPVFGTMQVPGPPIRFSKTPSTIQDAAHVPGADTTAVLASAGFSAEEVAALVEANTVGVSLVRHAPASGEGTRVVH